MISVRDVLAALLVLIATVLAAAWMPALWLDRNIVDRDGFRVIAEPLADDAEYQQTLSDQAVDALLDDDRVPGWLADEIEPIAEEQAVRLTTTDVYNTMWSETMQNLHAELFSSGPSEIVVDFAPAVEELITSAEELVPFLDIDPPQSVPVTVAEVPPITLLERAALLDPWAGVAGWAALALLVVALALAANRRLALVFVGIGGVLAGGAVLVVSANIETLVPDSVDQAAFVGPLVQEFEQHFAADLLPQAAVMAGAGAVAVVAGAVLLSVLPRRDVDKSDPSRTRTA